VSATMPKKILDDVQVKLNMPTDKTTIICRSNDQENIHLIVKKMQHPALGYLDLQWLL
jgi:hypothetical protein